MKISFHNYNDMIELEKMMAYSGYKPDNTRLYYYIFTENDILTYMTSNTCLCIKLNTERKKYNIITHRYNDIKPDYDYNKSKIIIKQIYLKPSYKSRIIIK